MDINLPLILMLLVAFTGVVSLVDLLVTGKPRRRALAALDQEYSDLGADEKENDDKYQAAYKRANHEPAVVEYSKSFFPVLALVFVLRSFLFEPFQIPSGSMIPTLVEGDFILVNKFSYGLRMPIFRSKFLEVGDMERGDVVVFFPPHEERYYIKRLVGLPGDVIRSENNDLYINGELIKFEVETYGRACGQGVRFVIGTETLGSQEHLARKCENPSYNIPQGEWTVPEGHYFMMGDNRDESSDGRAWVDRKTGQFAPFVPDENIVGKAVAVWMHWIPWKSWPDFSKARTIQ